MYICSLLMQVQLYASVWVCGCVGVLVCMCAFVCTYVLCVYLCLCVCLCVYVCICACMCVGVFVWVCAYMCGWVNTLCAEGPLTLSDSMICGHSPLPSHCGLSEDGYYGVNMR